MKTTDDAAIEETIVERLENGDNRNDIILDLCESLGLGWQQAETLVDTIHAEHTDDITLKQSPVLVVLALGIFLGGLILVGVTVYDITAVYSVYASAKSPASTGFLLYLFAYGGWFWEIGLLGIALIAGSLRGITDVWAAIFSKLGLFQGRE